MKKHLLLLLMLMTSFGAMAQLEVKPGSFKEVTGFVNINTEKMYDDNDRAYSVVKVKTENINDKERRQLLFEGDARTFFELEYKPGEVWVYISYYATYLKISHPDFGSTEFTIPFDMQGKKGYELTLINKPSVNQEFADRLAKLEGALVGGIVAGEYGYIVIRTTPVDGAMVIIDGQEMEMKTPFVSESLNVGPHRVRVEKEFYKPYVTIVNVEKGKSTNLDVELKKAIGSLEIVTRPSNVNITIGGVDKGKSPQLFDNMQAGDYKIELNKKYYQTVVKDVTIEAGEKSVVDVELKGMLRKTGWRFRPEIGIGIIDKPQTLIFHNFFWGSAFCQAFETNIHVNIDANIGYQLNPYIYLGAGVGLDLIDKASLIALPLFINPRFYFNKVESGFYCDIKAGVSLTVRSSKGYCEYNRDDDQYLKYLDNDVKTGDFSGSIELGYEYKHSSFGVSFNILSVSQTAKNLYDNTENTTKTMRSTFMIRYGYSIFKK